MRSESWPSRRMSRSCCMSSEGNSERFWPSSPICSLVQLLVPESRMFSEPDTLIAGPPGPSHDCMRRGSGDGSANERPCVRCAVVPPPATLLIMVRERSRQDWRKPRRFISRANSFTGMRVPAPSDTSPNSVAAATSPESGSNVTANFRGSNVSFRLGPQPGCSGSSWPVTRSDSSASRDALFQGGGRVSTGAWLTGFLRPKPGKASSRPRAGRVRASSIVSAGGPSGSERRRDPSSPPSDGQSLGRLPVRSFPGAWGRLRAMPIPRTYLLRLHLVPFLIGRGTVGLRGFRAGGSLPSLAPLAAATPARAPGAASPWPARRAMR